MELPSPGCHLGYTSDQVISLLGTEKTEQFIEFMRMTKLPMAECTGTAYSHLYKRHYATGCHGSPHGVVYFSVDIHRFLAAPEPVKVSYTSGGQPVERWVWGLGND